MSAGAKRKGMMTTLKHVLFAAILITAVAAVTELLAVIVFKAGLAVRAPEPVVTHPYHTYLGWENARSATLTGTRCGGRHAWAIPKLVGKIERDRKGA